jgi:phosphate starvation-inducible protein PhoH and related proteins
LTEAHKLKFELKPLDNERLALVCGQTHKFIKIIETFFNVKISSRGNSFKISGSSDAIIMTQLAIEQLYADTEGNRCLTADNIHLTLASIEKSWGSETASTSSSLSFCGHVTAKSKNQQEYLENIKTHDITFAIGPSGTGKTYLAAAVATDALQMNEVKRIILIRPAVEAGEKLGFLPGDLSEKVDPYLRPLLDSITSLMTPEKVNKLLEKNIIEIAPLAYMRGRTLNEAFIILDEAQNTTKEQMKMFLTRVGFGSKVIITGDISQIDLPKNQVSGLKHAVEVLADIDMISFTYLKSKDVIRHPIVEAIVNAYERHET